MAMIGIGTPVFTCNKNVDCKRIQTIYRRFFIEKFQVSADDSGSKTGQEERGKVLVGGGTGFVGTEVCNYLRRRGYRVVIVSRTSGTGRITWDVLASNGLPNNTTAVVNVAGHNILDKFRRWNDRFKEVVYESRILPTRMLRDAIEKCPRDKCPKAFVQISGVGYYPFDMETEFREDYQANMAKEGDNYFTKLVKDWEEAGMLKPGHPTRNVFIRCGVVLGRNGGLVQQILPQFLLFAGGKMGSGEQLIPWIHVKDVAGIIVHAIEDDRVAGVLNGVAPQVISNKEFVSSFASSLGRPCYFRVPAFLFNMVFGEERASLILKGQHVVPMKTLESGYKFKYPTIGAACEEFCHFFYQDPDAVSAAFR